MPDVLDPVAPAPTEGQMIDPFAGQDFDPLSLDPARLTEPGKPPKAAPASDTAEKDKATLEPERKTEDQILDPKNLKESTKTKDEPVNFKQLRELRNKAEEERDKLKTDLETATKEIARLASVEAKTAVYEAEKTSLEAKLKEREAKEETLQATLRRTAARETPEWKDTASAIHAAVAEVEKILQLQEVKDAGLSHSAPTLLDPNQKGSLNEILKVLSENGKLAEAQDLMEAHRSVNVWRGKLREIEVKTAEEKKNWDTNQELALSNSFREVRENISRVNPSLDPKSPEFQAMPKENQEFVLSQYKEAEAEAQKIVGLVDKPEILAAGAYHNALAMRLTAQALKGSQAQIEALKTEAMDLKAKLAAYEKAAGGGDLSGGSRTPAPSDTDDLSELAKQLDPRNMPGYRGMNMGV